MKLVKNWRGWLVNDEQVYADTDFILAIIKEDDWLQSNARDLLEKYDGDIVTSATTFLETLLVLKREGIKQYTAIVQDILEIAEPLHVEEETLFQAAFYMEDGANPFDAFHLAQSKDRKIISSDKEFDQLGAERIKLEKEN